MRKWTRQPPVGTKIDWTHPLADGLEAVHIIQNGKLVEAVSGTSHAIIINGSDYVIGSDAALGTQTVQRINDANNTHYAYVESNESKPIIPESIYSAVTQNCWIACNDGTNAWDTIYELGTASTEGGAWYGMALDTTNCSAFSLKREWGQQTTFFTNTNNEVPQDGKIHAYACAWSNSDNSGYATMYRDGVVLGDSTNFTTSTSDNTVSDYFQTAKFWTEKFDGSATTYQLKGSFAMYTFHSRKLTATEIKSLHDNPWQIFEQPKNFAFADDPDNDRILTIKRPWTKQPPAGTPIDWSNPLTNELVFFQSGGFDYTTGNVAYPVNPSATTPATKGVNNISAYLEAHNDTDSGWKFPESKLLLSIEGATGITHWASFTVDTFYAHSIIHEMPFNLTEWAGFPPYIYAGIVFPYSSSTLGLMHDVVGNSEYRVQSNSSFFSRTTDQGVHMTVCAKIGQSGTGYFYRDGQLYSSNYVADFENMVMDAPAHGHMFIGSRNDDAEAEGTDGRFNINVVWKRELTDTEVKQFEENPWQIFEPELVQVPYPYEEPTFDSTTEERMWMIEVDS